MAISAEGDVFVNRVTGERAIVRQLPADADGLIRAELWVAPGGAVAGAHVHPRTHERFEVLDGELTVRLGDHTSTARAGDVLEVPPGTVHDWWNAASETAHVMVEVQPGGDFERMIITLWGLAAAGRTDAKGKPGLLQLSLIAREFDDEIRFVSPPRWVQRLLFGALAPIARRRGMRGSHPELMELLRETPSTAAVTGGAPRSAPSA